MSDPNSAVTRSLIEACPFCGMEAKIAIGHFHTGNIEYGDDIKSTPVCEIYCNTSKCPGNRIGIPNMIGNCDIDRIDKKTWGEALKSAIKSWNSRQNRREISVVDYKQLRKDIYADLFDAMRTTDYVGSLDDRCNRLADRIMLYVKGQIALAQLGPVSGALEQCVAAVDANLEEQDAMMVSKLSAKDIAKAVLDAAGVKYVD